MLRDPLFWMTLLVAGIGVAYLALTLWEDRDAARRARERRIREYERGSRYWRGR
jgi:hypothetical protein